jgi:hypothetical protein
MGTEQDYNAIGYVLGKQETKVSDVTKSVR